MNDEKPKPGDRVKLFGRHRFAGYTGVYINDGDYLFGEKRPRVKIDVIGTVTFVTEPEKQMRKVGR